jgi:hypothetical protein
MLFLLAHHHHHVQQAPPLWQAAIGCLITAFLLCALHAAGKRARDARKARRTARPAYDPYPPAGRPSRGRR